MVVISFHEMDGVYAEMRTAACERQGCSVMILVANDVDAMASAKILTHMLRQDNIPYKTRPVASLQHIRETAEEIAEMDIRTVFLLNCGATANMVKVFDLGRGGDLRCIILDSHRPIHLANVYSRHNVAVLGEEQGPEEGISSGSEYSDNDSGDDEDSEDDADNGADGDADYSSDSEAEAEFEEGDGDGDESQHSEGGSEAAEDSDNDADEEGDDASATQTAEAGEGGSGRRVRRRLNDEEEGGGEGLVKDENADGAAPLDAVENAPQNEDSEEEDVVIGRRRATLAAAFDPLVRRRKLLRQYYNKVSSHEAPSAVLLIPLVKKLNRPCTPDLFWQAIIGVTDHYLRSTISEELYDSICEAIKSELPDDTRLFRVGEGTDEVVVPGAEAGVVAAGLDYPFFLYRHWSLYESMHYSDYVCMKLSSQKSKGAAKLQELLARMGIPLHQCKQNYSFMSPELRAHFRKELLGPVSAEFGLADPSPLFKSFYRYNAFKNPIAASDVVFAVSALIEEAGFPTSLHAAADGVEEAVSPGGDDADKATAESRSKEKEEPNGKSWMQAFNEGYDCLSMRPESDELLKKGITSAITIQKVIVGQGTAMLDSDGGILNLKSFRVGYIYRASLGLGDGHSTKADGADVVEAEMIFTRPLILIRLAQFLQKIQTENGLWAGKKSKPLLLAAEKGSSDSFIVIGVSAKGSCQTKFRKIFQKIASENEIKFSNDAFEASIIEIEKPSLELFLYKLMRYMNSYYV